MNGLHEKSLADALDSTSSCKGVKCSTVGIWAPNGYGNLGNEATMSAVIQNLRKLNPNITLYGISWNPTDTLMRHGIPSFPIRRGVLQPKASGKKQNEETGNSFKSLMKASPRLRALIRSVLAPLLELHFLKQILRDLRHVDLLVFAGTGPITDYWGGARRFPYHIYCWTRVARLSRTKVAFVSSGAGPIDSGISRMLFRAALSAAVYRSFRDEDSKRLIEGIGVKGANHVQPDLVFSLDIPTRFVEAAQPENKEVVIACLPYRKPGYWEKPDVAIYERYLNSIARLGVVLLQRGYVVRLLGTQERMDPVFVEDLTARILQDSTVTAKSRSLLESGTSCTFDGIMAAFAKASIVVTSRFHGVVFSYLLGRPVLGVAYHRKIKELMKDVGQEDFCVGIEDLGGEILTRKFDQLDSVRLKASSQIQRTVQQYRDLLEKQYRSLLRV